jgi:hypothetical protein
MQRVIIKVFEFALGIAQGLILNLGEANAFFRFLGFNNPNRLFINKE